MYAEKLMLETDDQGMFKQLPILPKNKHFEVIFLMLDDEPKTVRQPHPSIANQAVITGDIVDSVPQTAWDLPK